MSRFRILSIDGGGIKGVFPASFLAEIENAAGLASVAHCFDLIAGTSAGGIIALGLGLGLSARDMASFFVGLGPDIFPDGQKPTLRLLLGLERYDPGPLRAALKRVFGTKTLGDSRVRLLIPSFDANKADIHIFKTAHSSRLMMDYKLEAVEVAMATAAAPTFFPAYDSAKHIALVDGGVWANNPVSLAVVEAMTLLRQSFEDIDVLSLGCTEETLDFKQRGHSGLFWLRRGIFAAMRGQSRSALGMARHLTGRDRGMDKVMRIDPPVATRRFRLDGAKQIAELQGLGYSEARHALPYVRDRFFADQCEPFTSIYK
jgi:patatin-like phospholipase/acyl hydrolase